MSYNKQDLIVYFMSNMNVDTIYIQNCTELTMFLIVYTCAGETYKDMKTMFMAYIYCL